MDLQEAFDAGFDVVKAYVDRSFAAFEVRLAAIEAREPIRGEKGEPGQPGERGAAGEPGPPGETGGTGPQGEKGDKGDRGEAGEPGKQGADGPQGAPGQKGEKGEAGESVTPEDLAPLIATEVSKAIESNSEAFVAKAAETAASLIPKPQDGKDGKDGAPGQSGEKGEPGERGSDGLSGSAGVDGKDGVGVAGAVIDRDGKLILTLSDGSQKDMGCIVGRDGAAGRNGADGVGFDDMEVESDGERTVFLRFVRGERVKEFQLVLPVPLDRGVYKDGSEYDRGDCVSFGGSLFVAQEHTSDKPETSKAWRLAVKRGRDGKDLRTPEAPKQPVAVR